MVRAPRRLRNLGPSLDFGGQLVTSFGLTLGASLGLHYRIATPSIDEHHHDVDWEVANGSGIRPRARVNVGIAF